MLDMKTALKGLKAAAPNAPKAAIKAFKKIAKKEFSDTILFNVDCAAIVFGQLAHESLEFTAVEENLNYSAKRIAQVWPRHFTAAQAKPYGRNPEKLANEVYGGRMGNTRKGDGWRFKGAGYIHLTGRANFQAASDALGYDYVGRPKLARKPEHAWRIAHWYLCERKRKGTRLIDHAMAGAEKQVTRGINGGLNGFKDRKRRTELAREAMLGGTAVVRLGKVSKRSRKTVKPLQHWLRELGYPCGPVDGIWGALTEQSVCRFQVDHDLKADGIVGKRTLAALNRSIKAAQK